MIGSRGILQDKTRGWLIAVLTVAAFVCATSFSSGIKAETLPVKPASVSGLPPLSERLPDHPLVVDLEAQNREIGQQGGEIVTLIARARDIRYITTYAYTRLVGYDEDLHLRPDILERVDNDFDKTFTLHIRKGHRWSNGEPFTAEDFRYYWEDVAQNRELSPAGIPEFMTVDGKGPQFEVLDAQTVRFSWDKPNPRFLPQLAAPRDPLIYRPSHYLKKFHTRYADAAELKKLSDAMKVKSWAAVHNRLDDMNDMTNPATPTLQPWRVMNAAPANRFVFERNPYYHRIDKNGTQLPYIDRIVMDVAASGLMAAKANAGETNLLFRGLSMTDIPILKEGEESHGYRTLLWPFARGSEIALYPNLNCNDPVWRSLNRDLRFRRALSLGIDRHTLNNALLFGLGREGNNTIRPESPLFSDDLLTTNAGYDPKEAARLLDEIGLKAYDESGIRLLPDGRELEIIVETDGESSFVIDGLTLISEFWREIGIKLFIKPQDRTILRNRLYAGSIMMTAGQGLDNATPTEIMSPEELAPMHQDHPSWPKWGQYVETKGKNGEAIDIPQASQLKSLYRDWLSTADHTEQVRIWREMLKNHAENLWSIGTISGALQPIVVDKQLRNMPVKGLYSWEPSAFIGIYRLDQLFFSDDKKGAP